MYPFSFKDTYFRSPITKWSKTSMPIIFPDSTKRLVTWISSWEGLGSPEGWLCALIGTLLGDNYYMAHISPSTIDITTFSISPFLKLIRLNVAINIIKR